MTREELVAQLTQALRKAGYHREVQHDEERDCLIVPQRGDLELASLQADLAACEPEHRRGVVELAAACLLHPPMSPGSWAEAKPRILPMVQARIAQVAADLRRWDRSAPQSPVAHITEHLLFFLGVPVAGNLGYLPITRLGTWGVDPADAFLQAARNLEERTVGAWRESPEHPGVYTSPWQDGFDASRLFLPRAFASLPTKGRPVVLSPTPSLLLVAGSEDADGLFNLARLAGSIVVKEQMIHVLRALRMGEDGESWEDWLPAPGHPAYQELRYLRVIEESQAYSVQAAVLHEEADGGEVMPMPPLEFAQGEFGAAVITLTRWEAGAPSALPKADIIVLVRHGHALGAVAWTDLARVLPSDLAPMPGYPTRFLARHFPEDTQLAGVRMAPWREP